MAIPLVYRQCIIFTLCADGGGGERKGERIVVRLFPRAARYRSCEQRRDKSMYMCITLFRRYESRGRMRKGRNGRWLRVNSIEMNEWTNVNFLDSKSWGNSRKSQNTGCYLFLFFFFVSNWKIVRNFDFRNSSFKWLNRVVLYLNFKR